MIRMKSHQLCLPLKVLCSYRNFFLQAESQRSVANFNSFLIRKVLKHEDTVSKHMVKFIIVVMFCIKIIGNALNTQKQDQFIRTTEEKKHQFDNVFCSGTRLLTLLRPHPVARNFTEHIIMFLSELSVLRWSDDDRSDTNTIE